MFPREGSREIENTEREAIPANIGGGNIVGVAPRRFSNFSDINTIGTSMKWE
jgi:hypothetical protein